MPPHRARSIPRRTLLVLLAALALAGLSSGTATAQRAQIAPEPGSGREEKPLATARRHMVAAAHPLAVDAGLEILRAGGSAVDAAIAVQLVLGLVEPQSSGLGGGAFLLHWDERVRRVRAYDGRETAPAAARPDRFPPGWPFDAIAASGLSIGVPGVPRLMEMAHRAHGRLPWPRLFEPAIHLAEQGFPISPRLHALLTWRGAAGFAPLARRHFFAEDGKPWPVGYRLRNEPYAATLRRLAAEGAQGFYSGTIAAEIVSAVAGAPRAAGDITPTDLADYAAKERPPLCFRYRLRRICSMGPPSSGGIALAQILKLIEPFPAVRGAHAAASASALHLIAEAQKLAYADRDRYLADPDFVAIPQGLLDPGYLAQRRSLIGATRAMAPPPAGEPPGAGRRAMGQDSTVELAGTSHVSIVDGSGNAVALTTTIEAAFGSRVMAAGFLLNNQLTDFARVAVDKEGHTAANAVAGGKRPRSSMAPLLVFDRRGRLEAVLGSPGGSRIILYVAKAAIAMMDWRLDPQAATALPNFGSRGATFELESEPTADDWVRPLTALGHRVVRDDMTSGLHIIAIAREPRRLLGGADPRREGLARGD